MASGAAGTPLVEAARAFRPRILAERERIEAGRRLPEDLTRELARAGFFRIFLPAVYGGLDLSPVEAMEASEELGRGSRSRRRWPGAASPTRTLSSPTAPVRRGRRWSRRVAIA